MKHIIPISGKDSLATAIIQKQLQPELDYEYIFNPTGKELPETIEWIKKVEVFLNKPIMFIGYDMKQTEEWKKGFRPSMIARWCTRICKILPMEEHFNCEAVVYYGLRYDEQERIGYINKGKSELVAKYPLREVKYTIEDVLKLVNEIGLKPPTFHWQFLEDQFTKALGKTFIKSLKEWQRDQLFAGRKRNNCYDCFQMSRYEWIWLHDTHPDLFWSLVEDEEKKDTREKVFLTIPGLPLRELIQNRNKILNNHINKTTNALQMMKQKSMFDDDFFLADILSFTSCGLLCGK